MVNYMLSLRRVRLLHFCCPGLLRRALAGDFQVGEPISETRGDAARVLSTPPPPCCPISARAEHLLYTWYALWWAQHSQS